MRHEKQISSKKSEAAKLVLGLARRLHKAARSESLALSLPVLRRLLSTGTLHGMTLAALRRKRITVQRKHILRTLAAEAGFASWEAYRHSLARMAASELEHYELIAPTAGYPNLWFSTPSQAARHAKIHGGRAFRVGSQGVVVGPN